MAADLTMAQPWPPGTEPEVPGADLGTVKAPGSELARHWPDGPPGMVPPGAGPAPPDGGNGGSGPHPPVAAFTWAPPTAGRGDYADFDGTGSQPGDAPLTRYDWQFADKASMPDAGPAVRWRLPGAYGSYPVTLTVTASDSQAGAVTHTITLSPP